SASTPCNNRSQRRPRDRTVHRRRERADNSKRMRSSLGTGRRDDPGPTLKHFAAKGVKLFNPWSGNPDDGSAAAFVQTLEQPFAWRHAVELGTAYFRQGWRDLGH